MNQKFVDYADGNAEILSVDFKNSEEAARTFTKWAETKTKKGLKLNEVSFDPTTKMSMATALYYKANWVFKFQPATKGTFNTPDGPVEVDMLHMNREFRWGKIGDYAEWAAVPYESDDSLIIILPNKGSSLDDLMKTFDEKALIDVLYDFDRDSNDVREEKSLKIL